MKFDFSGYATKYGVMCSDGRTIAKDAFKHHHGAMVPLLWNHDSTSPENVVGHAMLEHREDGLYMYGLFNGTELGKASKELVSHDDVKGLSIHANKLKEVNGFVKHGMVREVSLVIAGANPGAFIDVKSLQHSDSDGTVESFEGILYGDIPIANEPGEIELTSLQHSDESEEEVVEEEVTEEEEDDAEITDETVIEALDILDGLTPEQMEAVYTVYGYTSAVLAAENGDDTDPESVSHSAVENLGGLINMKKNVFDKSLTHSAATISGADLKQIVATADAEKMNLKKAFENYLNDNELKHAEGDQAYGIKDIHILFPDAKDVTLLPQFVKRQTGWVSKVMSGVRKSPFSRIKTTFADITEDEARAKGYIKGDQKLDEIFSVFARTTIPTTIFKKQKLDRDDIIDITSFDVVTFVKMEMRIMFDEEVGRAILVGDGRAVSDRNKIKEGNIRPIYSDDEFYSHKVQLAHGLTIQAKIEAIMRARKHYRGTGTPTMFTTADFVIDALLLKDTNGRFIYETKEQLARVLRVEDIVEVEVMENVSRTVSNVKYNLDAILVNLTDYTVGTDKGGQVAFFDDFDIDFNQEKYLMESRMSGALTAHKSALVIETAATAPAQG